MRSALTALGLALAATLVAAIAGSGRLGQRVEHFFYDQRFLQRERLGVKVPVHPDLVLVTIDEDTYGRLDEPPALWLPHFGQLLEGLFAAGARTVGLDWIPSYAPPELFGPFGTTALAHRGQLICAANLDGRLVLPAPPVVAAVGTENLGLITLTRDADGILRRQLTQPVAELENIEFFSVALLRAHTDNIPSLPDRLAINYAGPPGKTFPQYSMQEILERIEAGEDLRPLFEGRLVLIGSVARADLDLVETPYTLAFQTMPGVEIHGHFLNTVLSNLRLSPVNPAAAWLGLLTLAWLAALASLRLPPLAAAAATGLAGLGWLGLGLLLFCQGGWLLTSAPMVVALPAALAGGYAYRYLFVERDRQRVKRVFGRYVCPEVMEEMLREHQPEQAVRRKVTVMFSDINNFSTACEQLEPEEVTRRLNHHFTEMSQVIFRNRGTIIRFIGDEFMVLFGAPRPDPQQERSAVRTAAEMVARLNELRRRDPEEKEGFYSIKIGIHVGDMILTSIGSQERSDYNCIGDSTNMAARVLSLTKPTGAGVLLSEDVYEVVKDEPDLTFVDRGVHPVKGRRGEIRVYELEVT
ncbi:MAG: adenylate/guanylate cyclase domain-containing protein [Candidatus Eremiobacteraeota bacterium]|nr:adenylate/guanylate cyclase domain-containing protein [Candidatus Eremiobacteraeota bacterium]